MALMSLQNVSVGYGGPLLIDGADLQIERGERICLVGRNGAGKSTLLSLLHGDVTPDSGEIIRRQGLRIALLPQEVPQGLQGTTFEIVSGGLDKADSLFPASQDDAEVRKRQQVDKTLSRMSLDPTAPFESLSAGLKRRVVLARGPGLRSGYPPFG